MAKKPQAAAMQEKIAGRFAHLPAQDARRMFEIELSKIEPNPDQPRKRFDEQGLRELATSIEKYGLLQPVTLKRTEDPERYLLVAGERRFRAHRLLERERIYAIITDGNPDEISLIENIQREDLDPIEEAEAMTRMMERYSYTQEDLGKVIGKAQNTVSEILRLNALPDRIREEYRSPDTGQVNKSLLIALARLKNEEEQLGMWEEIKAGGVTVRSARQRKASGGIHNNEHSELAKTVSAGRSFVRKIGRLPPEKVVAHREHYAELLQIREEIDKLLVRCEESQQQEEPPAA
jgi:ParB family transcriptional regulator, chromosome partitioning protein